MQKLLEKLGWSLLVVIWLSHLIQVFTPEVGFDAVWYHLPVIQAIVSAKKLVYLPELYQSLNPLWSDLIFGLGFWLGGDLGAKVVAYLFGISLVIVTYLLARKFLNKEWSLWVILLISVFQVVAWQSASFYVDVAKAVWELATLLVLIKWRTAPNDKWLVLAGLFFGASLATKLFSLFLLPVMWWLICFWRGKTPWRSLLIFGGASLLLPLPFYWWSWVNTGQIWYSFGVHLAKLGEIGANSSLGLYFGQRTLDLWKLPLEVILGRDYTSFLLILFLPVLLIYFSKIKAQPLLTGLGVFTLFQVMLWWYLPPLSTRYALLGFIVWLILSIWSVAQLIKDKPVYRRPILITLSLALLINFAPRLVVNWRSWQYLSGRQTKDEYIRQFFDGNVDHHLIKWHQLEERNWEAN
jgi:4-amino-4-deoxy-L-arabinose transferase-like glycosyltransferase